MSENYILAYYQKIKDGTISAGKWIKLWYEKVVHAIEAKELIYDQKKAYAAIIFIEHYCRHSKGELGGRLLKLELWQKAFLSVIFGIVAYSRPESRRIAHSATASTEARYTSSRRNLNRRTSAIPPTTK